MHNNSFIIMLFDSCLHMLQALQSLHTYRAKLTLEASYPHAWRVGGNYYLVTNHDLLQGLLFSKGSFGVRPSPLTVCAHHIWKG